MSPQLVSIISTLVNFFLGLAKLFFGLLTGSLALAADGIHSGMDVFSSLITFWGIKVSQKPVDEKHPYGHWRAESLSGFLVTIILFLSGLWILFEATKRFFGEKPVVFSKEAILVIIISVILTELMARLKFAYGRKYQSLSLVADAEHSRADAFSSLGVLAGLILVRYFNLADGIIALGIGLYIIYESFNIGKEITDSLLDVSNKEVESRIEKICHSHNIEIADLKTRKIGAYNFAEIKIKLPPKLKVEEVQKITETLENRLLSNIPELKEIVISIEAYEMAKTIVLPKLGREIGELKGFEKIGPKKTGERIIVPIENGEISDLFGASQYLIIDKKGEEIALKKTVNNPYFEKDAPHGTRFAKAIRADKILVRQIGPNAKQSLNNYGIEVEIIQPEANLGDILELIKKGKENA